MGHIHNNTTKIAMLLAVLIVGAMMSGCVESDVKESTTAIVKPTIVPTVEPIPVVTPTVKTGTYENPTPIGSTLVSDTEIFAITIAGVYRGEKANEDIKNANMFNDDPQKGYEYMIVSVVFEYQGKDKFILSSYDFKAYANNVECTNPFIVLPDSLSEMEISINIMPGGIITGFRVYEVPIESQVTISYERMFSKAYYLDAGSESFVLKPY